MTSDEQAGEIAVRLNHYRTADEQTRAIREIGDLPANHPFRLVAGWSPAGRDTNVDLDLIGPMDAAEIHESARVLMSAATELFARAEQINTAIVDAQFEEIVSGPNRDEVDQPHGDDPPQGIYPSWGQMPMLDRALVIDYIEEIRTRGFEFDPARPMRYAKDPHLVSLPDRYAHAHALHLADEFGVPDSLDQALRSDLKVLSFRHRTARGAE